MESILARLPESTAYYIWWTLHHLRPVAIDVARALQLQNWSFHRLVVAAAIVFLYSIVYFVNRAANPLLPEFEEWLPVELVEHVFGVNVREIIFGFFRNIRLPTGLGERPKRPMSTRSTEREGPGARVRYRVDGRPAADAPDVENGVLIPRTWARDQHAGSQRMLKAWR